ncbi:hypothetical protein SCALM49S_02228 [Streptomyces californicus]
MPDPAVETNSSVESSSTTTCRTSPLSPKRAPALRPSEYRPAARAAMWSALSGSMPWTDFTSPSAESRTALRV